METDEPNQHNDYQGQDKVMGETVLISPKHALSKTKTTPSVHPAYAQHCTQPIQRKDSAVKIQILGTALFLKVYLWLSVADSWNWILTVYAGYSCYNVSTFYGGSNMVLIEKMSSITAMPRTVGNENIPRIFGSSAEDGQVYEWNYAENGWKPFTSNQNAQ